MALYRVAGDSLERVAETTFAKESLKERGDIQSLLRADISVLDADLMVVAEEFGDWRTAEADWPELQEQLIATMVKLERAFRAPVAALPL